MVSQVNGVSLTAAVSYSLNGGATFVGGGVYTANGPRAAKTDVISLPANQDLSKVVVDAGVTTHDNNPATQYILEVYIIGTP